MENFAGFVVPLGLALFVATQTNLPGNLFAISAGLGIVTALCLAVACGWQLSNLSRAAPVYVILFALFHFSLFFVTGFLGVSALSRNYVGALDWIRSDEAAQAAELGAVGLVVFTFAARLVSGSQLEKRMDVQRASLRENEVAVARLGETGSVILILGLLMWSLQIVQSGGLGALSLNYVDFLATAGPLSAFGTLFVGLGFALSPFGTRRTRRVCVTLFAIFAFALFPLGLRGTVLFPIGAWVVSRKAAGLRTPTWAVAAGSLSTLVLAAGVRAVRDGGSSSAVSGGVARSLVDSLSELGGSIFVTVLTIRWQDAGEQPDKFTSFYIVFLRTFENLVLGLSLDDDTDTRIFNVKILLREGPFGGSPVAEGYHALGAAGVVATMVVLGMTIGFASRKQLSSVIWLGYSAAVFIPLFVNVRNSFAPVPLQILIGIMLVKFTFHALTPRRAGAGLKRTVGAASFPPVSHSGTGYGSTEADGWAEERGGHLASLPPPSKRV